MTQSAASGLYYSAFDGQKRGVIYAGSQMPEETMIKANLPRSQAHIHASEREAGDYLHSHSVD